MSDQALAAVLLVLPVAAVVLLLAVNRLDKRRNRMTRPVRRAHQP